MARPAVPAVTPASRVAAMALRFAPVLHVLSAAVLLFSPAMLVPLGVSRLLGDGAASAFERGFLVTFVTGLVVFLATRGLHRRELQPRDGFLLVTLVWTVVPGFATIPLLQVVPGMAFTDAFFEAVSAMTATGATVITGLDGLPPSINLWRALMVWIGGMGIIVLAVAILPLLGVGGSQLFKAETPGCMKDTKITPRIADTAKGLWLVYFVFSAICVLAYRLAGMSWIDALVHAGTTMGLGGFSSYDASIGRFDSPAIEAVSIAFMTLAAINFATHFLALRRRSPLAYVADGEARRVVIWLAVSSLLVSVVLVANGTYADLGTALRHATFNVVSVATTTGYASVDYAQWPAFAPIWMLFLSCFVTSSGSTGGGIKLIRAVLLFKQTVREMTRTIHPRAVVPVKFGEQVIENNVIFAVLAFMLMWGGTIIVMSMVLMATGADVVTAVSAIIACVNNMGPGLGQVGPAANFGVLTDFQTWVCTFTMLLGRLELFTVLVLLTPAFWRK